jgi:hypothetical protein
MAVQRIQEQSLAIPQVATSTPPSGRPPMGRLGGHRQNGEAPMVLDVPFSLFRSKRGPGVPNLRFFVEG